MLPPEKLMICLPLPVVFFINAQLLQKTSGRSAILNYLRAELFHLHCCHKFFFLPAGFQVYDLVDAVPSVSFHDRLTR